MRVAGSYLLVLSVAGCAITGKECTPPEPAIGKAGELIIYRPSQQVARFYDAPISIDDCILGMLADGSVINRNVTEGAVKIRAEKRALAMGGDAEIRTGVSAGETVYIRFGFLTLTAAHFSVVDKATAEKEMPSLQNLLR